MTTSEQKEVLNVNEAAELLELTPDAIRKKVKRHQLRSCKVNGRFMIAREALLPFVGQKTNRGRPRSFPNLNGDTQRRDRGLTLALCPSGPIPGFKAVLEELGTDSDEFAFIAGLPGDNIKKIERGGSIEAQDRGRVLETVVALRRRKQENEDIKVRKTVS